MAFSTATSPAASRWAVGWSRSRSSGLEQQRAGEADRLAQAGAGRRGVEFRRRSRWGSRSIAASAPARCAAARTASSGHVAEAGDVVAHGAGVERRVLRQPADAPRRRRADVHAGDAHLAAADRVGPGEAAQQRRFAGAARPGDRDDLAGGDREADRAQRRARGAGGDGDEAADLDRRRAAAPRGAAAGASALPARRVSSARRRVAGAAGRAQGAGQRLDRAERPAGEDRGGEHRRGRERALDGERGAGRERPAVGGEPQRARRRADRGAGVARGQLQAADGCRARRPPSRRGRRRGRARGSRRGRPRAPRSTASASRVASAIRRSRRASTSRDRPMTEEDRGGAERGDKAEQRVKQEEDEEEQQGEGCVHQRRARRRRRGSGAAPRPRRGRRRPGPCLRPARWRATGGASRAAMRPAARASKRPRAASAAPISTRTRTSAIEIDTSVSMLREFSTRP